MIDIVNSNQEKNKKSIFFIVCQKEIMNEIVDKNLKKSDNVYVNDTKDMIFVFNTLFESDKISNDMKKSVWKDLIYSLSYE